MADQWLSSTAHCISGLVAAHAHRTPDAIALVDRSSHVSFGELEIRATRQALVLAAHGVGPEVVVGLCGDKSCDLIVAMLAILKAGGAYLPLDPSYPSDRLTLMVRDSGAQLVIASARRMATFAPYQRLALETLGQEKTSAQALREPAPDNVAVVLYTSGSTGPPKGVMLSHRSIVHQARNGWPDPRPTFDAFSISTSAGMCGVFLRLILGSTVIIMPRAAAMAAEPLGVATARHQVARLIVVPWQLGQIVAASGQVRALYSGVRTINVAGDAFSPRLAAAAKAALPSTQILNSYGATEVTGLVASGEVSNVDVVGVGRPTAACTVQVLDESLRHTADDEVGAIYVAGPLLARGYVNRPSLTASRFVPDPYGPQGARMYRTGDRGRRQQSGELVVVGRTDHQVKIRGYRVELGEVESVILSVAGVTDAAVIVDGGGDRLLAFITLGAEYEPRAEHVVQRVREALKATLATYMTPAAITVVPDLPRTTNGKIDRAALWDATACSRG